MSYIKPTATYKMSKSLKTSLALGKFSSKDQKDAWKSAMIQAELGSQIKVRDKRKSESDTGSND
jgi:hypothetical protein